MGLGCHHFPKVSERQCLLRTAVMWGQMLQVFECSVSSFKGIVDCFTVVPLFQDSSQILFHRMLKLHKQTHSMSSANIEAIRTSIALHDIVLCYQNVGQMQLKSYIYIYCTDGFTFSLAFCSFNGSSFIWRETHLHLVLKHVSGQVHSVTSTFFHKRQLGLQSYYPCRYDSALCDPHLMPAMTLK